MVAINVILLSECTGKECGGDNDICTDSRVHRGNAENRAPITRNHRSAPIIGHWTEQDPAQYINGANTYQFVDSSPVGNVDAEGTKWTITRDGKARATVSGQKGDTVASLLATKDNHGNLILLDASQYKKWLRPVGGPKLPATDTSPLKCDEKFTIPNIAYIADTLRHPLPIPFVDFERASRQDMRWADLHGIPNGYAVKWKGQGLDVVWLTCFTMAKLKSDLGSLDLYKFVFVGHGDETNHGTLVMPNGTPELSPGTYTKYGIAAMYLYACYSGAAKDPAGIDPMQYWRSDVSMDGWFIGWSGPVDAITVVTGWGEVRTHGTR